jgi:hypothetical protein
MDHKNTEKYSKQKGLKNEPFNELKAMKTEYENLMKLYDELNSKIQRSERKLSALESQINENIEVRGQVTSFAFRLLEQNVKIICSKFSDFEKDLLSLKNENSSSGLQSRMLMVENELKSLNKSYSTLDEKIKMCLKGNISFKKDVVKKHITQTARKENLSPNLNSEIKQKFNKDNIVVANKDQLLDNEIQVDNSTLTDKEYDPFEDYFSSFASNTQNLNHLSSVVVYPGFPSLDTFQAVENIQINNDNTQLIIFDEYDTIPAEDKVEIIAESFQNNTVKERTLYILVLVKETLKLEKIDKDTDIYENLKTDKCIFTLNRKEKWMEFNVFINQPGFSLSRFLHSNFSVLMKNVPPRLEAPESFYTIHYSDEKLRFSKGSSINNIQGLNFYFIDGLEGLSFTFVRNNVVELKSYAEISSKHNDETGKKDTKEVPSVKVDIKKISANLSSTKFGAMKSDKFR